jgi:hypothetical protein
MRFCCPTCCALYRLHQTGEVRTYPGFSASAVGVVLHAEGGADGLSDVVLAKSGCPHFVA